MRRFHQKIIILLIWLSAAVIIGGWVNVDRIRKFTHEPSKSMMASAGSRIDEGSSITSEIYADIPESIVNGNKGIKVEDSITIHPVCGNRCFLLGSTQQVITITLVNESDWFKESNSKESEPWFAFLLCFHVGNQLLIICCRTFSPII